MPSRAIETIQYDGASRRLAVGFTGSGRTYVFFEVPYGVVEAFANARSKGAYFNRHIKDRYAFEQLTEAV